MPVNRITADCPTCGSGLDSSGNCNACLLSLGISQPPHADTQPCPTSLPTLEALNAQFPQLEVTRLVGRGGMGAIYHARQTTLDRDVALKLIAKEVSSDSAFVDRFEREAKTLAKLSHPNIVTIYDYGHTSDGTAYLILEFVDGINLREAISSGNIGPDEALDLVTKICSALEYAHSKGVVHRDIKPENILLGEDGSLKVADFGIAKIVDDSVRAPTLTAPRQILGSMHYLAPEHLEAPDQVDHRVDLYALGVVFYELLTGQLPLGRYEPPSSVRDRVDRRLDPIVLKTLNRKPKQRYQNAKELGAEIGVVATSLRDRPSQASVGNSCPEDPAIAQGSKSSVSVPFVCASSDGMSCALGSLVARDGSLRAEFRIRSAWGYVKKKLHEIEIPRDRLTRIELVPGAFAACLVITSDSISTLGCLPNAETGRVCLNIKRADEGYAREIAHVMGFDAIQTAGRQTSGGPIRWPNQLGEAERIMFGIAMIICGVLNAGLLAVGILILSGQLTGVWLPISLIAASVLIGPVSIMQIITGIFNLVGRARGLSLATSFLSVLPVSPAWILSCPLGIWAYHNFNRDTPSDSVGQPVAKKHWGTTTLLLIRESRWATATGFLSIAGGILVMTAFVGFQLGYYPVSLHYRIVDADAEITELDRAIESRLQHAVTLRGIEYQAEDRPNTITVKTWNHQRAQVDDLLRIHATPQLVWLEAPSDGPGSKSQNDASSSNRTIPVASGLELTPVNTSKSGLGRVVHSLGDAIDLAPTCVRGVEATQDEGQTRLTVELTSIGREKLASSRGAESAAGLGLIVGGVVEGLADRESLSQKAIVFQLPDNSELTPQAIISGIRGPSIPSELELLD